MGYIKKTYNFADDYVFQPTLNFASNHKMAFATTALVAAPFLFPDYLLAYAGGKGAEFITMALYSTGNFLTDFHLKAVTFNFGYTYAPGVFKSLGLAFGGNQLMKMSQGD